MREMIRRGTDYGVNWIHVKIRKGVNGNSRREKWKREKIRDAGRREAERAGRPRFGRKRTARGGFAKVRSRVCKTENAAGDGKEEERVSGWFIESLSGAVDLCAEEGACGGAFI